MRRAETEEGDTRGLAAEVKLWCKAMRREDWWREGVPERKGKVKEDMDEEPNKYPVDDVMFDLDDSDVADIMSTDGRTRRFRGSIYIDEIIPETDDVEYDRKLAIKVLENYAKKLPTREYYIGGAGFKQRSLIEPYDSMDF